MTGAFSPSLSPSPCIPAQLLVILQGPQCHVAGWFKPCVACFLQAVLYSVTPIPESSPTISLIRESTFWPFLENTVLPIAAPGSGVTSPLRFFWPFL
jgi:hypothetical protein